MTAPQVQLNNGVTYRGRILVFSPIGVTTDKVNQGFANVGFTNVQSWLDESDLPADWPSFGRDDVAPAEDTQAWVEGTWSKPDGQYAAGGQMWELYDYWPKNVPAPVQVSETPKPNYALYAAVVGGAAIIAVLFIAAVKGDH